MVSSNYCSLVICVLQPTPHGASLMHQRSLEICALQPTPHRATDSPWGEPIRCQGSPPSHGNPYAPLHSNPYAPSHCYPSHTLYTDVIHMNRMGIHHAWEATVNVDAIIHSSARHFILFEILFGHAHHSFKILIGRYWIFPAPCGLGLRGVAQCLK